MSAKVMSEFVRGLEDALVSHMAHKQEADALRVAQRQAARASRLAKLQEASRARRDKARASRLAEIAACTSETRESRRLTRELRRSEARARIQARVASLVERETQRMASWSAKLDKKLVLRESKELARVLADARQQRRKKREKAQAERVTVDAELEQARLAAAYARRMRLASEHKATERAELSGDLWHSYERERVSGVSHVVHLTTKMLKAAPVECGVFEYPEDYGDFERCEFPRRPSLWSSWTRNKGAR